jgi:quinoprotein glucose dehydrogenase
MAHKSFSCITRLRLLLFCSLSLGLAGFALSAVTSPEYRTLPAAADSELTPSLSSANPEHITWSRSNGDDASSRYSSLRQINAGNVKQLKVAWIYHSQDGNGNIQCNPVIANGVMYAPTTGRHIVAIDAATGRELWRFAPDGRPAMRGLLYWAGDQQQGARLFFSSGDWLYALDPKDGKPIKTFGQNGRVAARSVVTPAVYQHTLVIVCWNVVRAFDVMSGSTLWSFNLIPQSKEYGSDTWAGPGYGANTWGGMSLDQERGIAFISTGSPHPNYLGMHHPGDNLFSDCVIAIDAKTGKRIWYFQEIRHDIWDLDIPAPPNLVTVTRNHRRYDAVAQVTKMGNTLLLDRLTGKPLFPFRLRRAPASSIPEEHTAGWQPDLQLPEPFAPQEFSLNDVTDIGPQEHEYILKSLGKAEFGWFKPFDNGVPLVFYGMHGGAEWTGAAFDPASSWLYISANKLPWVVTISRAPLLPKRIPPFTPGNKTYLQYCAYCHGPERDGAGMAPPLFTLPKRLHDAQVVHTIHEGNGAMPSIPVPDSELPGLLDFLFERDLTQAAVDPAAANRQAYKFDGYRQLLDQAGHPGVKPPWGTLNAINLNTGRIEWRVPLGEYEDLVPRNLSKTGTLNFGGAMVTAGDLVFCAGTTDLKIRAFNSHNGDELWAYKLPFGGYAPPATYEVKGRQFVVISATGGGKLGGQLGDAYVAFALPH